MKMRGLLTVLLFVILLFSLGQFTAAQDTPTPEVTAEVTPEATPVVTPGEVVDVFRPELTWIAATALAVVTGIALLILGRYGVTVAKVRAWGAQYEVLVDIAYNTVARLRVTSDELEDYQKEAQETGRDVRLIAAYREIEELATDLGIPFNLTLTISLIERILDEQQRDAGLK